MSAVEVTVMGEAEARRLTERIRYTAMSVRDSVTKLQRLVADAQEGRAHIALGYQSWTAYLVDVMGDEPLRLARDQRRDVVAWLSGEGMSTRAIAPIVGVHHDTVASDIKSGVGIPTPASEPAPIAGVSKSQVAVDVQVSSSGHVDAPIIGVNNATVHRDLGRVANATPESEAAQGPGDEPVAESDRADAPGSVVDVMPTLPPRDDDWVVTEPEGPAPVTGLDGKTYKKPAAAPVRRKSLIDDAYTVERSLFKTLEKLREITRDDRFKKNKASIQDVIRPVADLAQEILADLFTTQSQED